MKFLLDQDVYASTFQFLTDLGHDVVTAYKLGLSRAGDAELLRIAHEQSRLFITRDRDFGELVYVHDSGTGVIYLRITPSILDSVHQELARVLKEHSENELKHAFVVVEPGRHRFRKLR